GENPRCTAGGQQWKGDEPSSSTICEPDPSGKSKGTAVLEYTEIGERRAGYE
ncbi:unnamed protein product, partial [Ectocarpus sp. 12 AP-2014]